MGIGGEFVGDLEKLLVTRTLHSKALFRMTGSKSQCWKAEAEIEQMYPGMRCLLLPSATMGLAIVLELLNLKPGQEVLISPFGWVANWSCIVRAGLIPRFLPLNDQLQLETDAVSERINERTGAIIVTHLQGRGQQAVGEIAGLCQNTGIALLEDVAQSFGIKVQQKRAGTFGASAWCSFNHNKILSAGDGGFVLIKDSNSFAQICALHDQGNILVNGKRRQLDAFIEPGVSLRVNETTGAVIRAQITRFNLIQARIKIFNSLLTAVIEDRLKLKIIPHYTGDIPFTVLFERPAASKYPSLADTGWHLALNVPWLTDLCHKAVTDDYEIVRTIDRLKKVSAVGAGFIDFYYGIQLGLSITDTVHDVNNLVKQLKEIL